VTDAGGVLPQEQAVANLAATWNLNEELALLRWQRESEFTALHHPDKTGEGTDAEP
jgi:hypothetical protein